MLRSGDIDMTLPDKTTRDRAQALPSSERITIYRREYLVEVPFVPLSVYIVGAKQADNTELAGKICEASKSLSLGIKISWIRWLHALKTGSRKL